VDDIYLVIFTIFVGYSYVLSQAKLMSSFLNFIKKIMANLGRPSKP
jgi:hypothetical protein